ncbi:MAG TPA: nucleotide exchange factor GrpE [Acidobacteriaceae bacterium]|jgi:molecular chaperone GrpE|nr:nucleotide exchange factor GrpE [Acidobacteriaceae bacterium]
MSRKVTETANEGQQNNDQVADSIDGAEESRDATQPGGVEATAQLQNEVDRLKAERDQLVDRLARLQAEFENARKRETRERTDFRDFAVSGAVEQFLPVLDNFQLALASPGSVEQLRAGIELILKQMEDVLRSLNVVPVETVGARFDPRVHEALESVDRTDLPDHQVLEEVRRGYRIRDRLLRPALVRIVNNPQQKEA